ncbi:MAG: hypothetical protein OEY01_03650 [Desulfobulbaceae bacterium]|nr:hypothetical protein [Desulfobulbaceae bacterium]
MIKSKPSTSPRMYLDLAVKNLKEVQRLASPEDKDLWEGVDIPNLEPILETLKEFAEDLEWFSSSANYRNHCVAQWVNEEENHLRVIFPTRMGEAPGMVLSLNMVYRHMVGEWEMLEGPNESLWKEVPLMEVGNPFIPTKLEDVQNHLCGLLEVAVTLRTDMDTQLWLEVVLATDGAATEREKKFLTRPPFKK